MGPPNAGAWLPNPIEARNSSDAPVASRNASSSVACRFDSSKTRTPSSCAKAPTRSESRPVTASLPSGSVTTAACRARSSRIIRSGWSTRITTALRLLVEMKSLILPLAIRLPRPTTTRESAISAISDSRWLETKMDRPCPASVLSMLRSQCTPWGSRPFAGSSRINVPGSPRSAVARPRRWPMPRENVLGLALATSPSPTRLMTSVTRLLGIWFETANMRRWLTALRVGWNGLASRTDPTWRSGCLSSR